jgi:hypothetical protein
MAVRLWIGLAAAAVPVDPVALVRLAARLAETTAVGVAGVRVAELRLRHLSETLAQTAALDSAVPLVGWEGSQSVLQTERQG